MGLVSDKFHSSDNETEATYQTRQLFGQKPTTWLRRAPETTSKLKKKLARGRLFQQTANMRSAYLTPVQSKHHFRHAISMCLLTKCGPRDLLKKTPNIRTQNNTFCTCWCRFPSPRPQGAPEGTPRASIWHHFRHLLHDWPDDLSRLLPASNFQPKTTLQTSKSIRSEQPMLVRSTSIDPFTYIRKSLPVQINFTI